MNRKTWDTWGVAIMAGFLTGIPLLVASVYLGAWATGVPIQHPLNFDWLLFAIHLRVPLWFTSLFITFAAVMTTLYFKQRFQVGVECSKTAAAENAISQMQVAHAEELKKMNSNEPKLHGVWNQTQSFWSMGRHGNDPSMQIGGWIDLTSSNTKDNIFLLAAYIDGHRAQIFMDVPVKPGIVNKQMVMLFFHPPLTTEVDKPCVATIVVEDQFNRKYELPRQSFRATPSPLPAPAAPVPELTLVWRSLGWYWTKQDGELAVRLTGDGYLQVDNVPEKVLMVDVRIEGAEHVGIFESFELELGQRSFRGISENFKGLKPNGQEPITVTMTFVDFKGRLYPVKETTFKALPNPEQYNGISWANMNR